MDGETVTTVPIDSGEDLASTLKLLRVLAGRTQQSIAEPLNFSPGRVGEYERGVRSMRVTTLLRLLAELGWQMTLVQLDSAQSNVQESEHH
jgi:transcriptional regulator with XRE-family HTH domain